MRLYLGGTVWLYFKDRQCRNSFKVPNNRFGRFILRITRMIAKRFGYVVVARGRKPIPTERGKHRQSLPHKYAQILHLYFNRVGANRWVNELCKRCGHVYTVHSDSVGRNLCGTCRLDLREGEGT